MLARERFEAAITQAWYHGAWWLWLLWPLSALVKEVARRRRQRFLERPPEASPVPVCIVGGITVGGTGKTPVIIALARALEGRGLRVGVVSRGYGGRVGDDPVLVTARSTADMVGDEPLLIALTAECPVAVGHQRARAVDLLVGQHELDLVLSDDGLQHYGMARAWEIVVLDAKRKLGNGHLLPMGPLREPQDRLDDVDWILERGGADPDTGFHYRLACFRHWGSRARLFGDQAVADWQRCTVAAVTGLGQPEQFFDMVESLGLEITRHPFPDHYTLTRSDLDGIVSDIIVTTEKDAVKIESFDDDRIWVMTIEALVPGVLVDALVARFKRESTCSM